MLSALLDFLASLVPLLREVLSYLREREVCWWQPPTGTTHDLLQDLKPVTQKQYVGVLTRLHHWIQRNGIQVRSLVDLDKAVYGYLPTVSRHEARTVIAALYKAYPPTRNNLPWALARAKAVSTIVPVTHHPAMPWMLALALAWATVSLGYPHRALLMLITWKFGLRPGEGIALRGSDVYIANFSKYLGALPFLRLGVRAGTKLRRPQLARARREDTFAQWLLQVAAVVTPYDARISDIAAYPVLNTTYKLAAKRLGVQPIWTPHCPRSGWASWRWACGQDFPGLREDGRWTSDSSLRVYLDQIGVEDHLQSSDLAPLRPWMEQLEASAPSWLWQPLVSSARAHLTRPQARLHP